MSDQAISTETASASTSAAAETVENTEVSTPSTEEKAVETSKPFDNGDPWAGLGEETEDAEKTEPETYRTSDDE